MFVSSLFPSLLFALSGPVLAHGGPGHDLPSVPVAVETTQAEAVVPETFPEVVAALSQSFTEAQTAIEAVKVADVQRSCTRLNELALAIPTQTGALSEADQAAASTAATQLGEKVAQVLERVKGGDLEAANSAVAAAGEHVALLESLAE